ncbi:MAG TPA: IPT/TIG domain-containing protein, partial [Kofleriaceae bacterium]|nr:IPT/TIG domain-containing protein [Kofleriaceae bacterium]
MRISAVFVVGSMACGMSTTSGPTGPLRLDAISPAVGSVGGGTRVDLTGSGMSADVAVTIGGVACTSVMSDSDSHASCVTGDAAFLEGPADVVATRGGETQTLAGAYTYKCLWQTSTGRASCGAVPPVVAAEQQVDTWITQFQGDHGFVASAGGAVASSMADTTDFTLGTQSVFVDTNGAGAISSISRTNMPAIDMSNAMLKVWVRIDNAAHASRFDIILGSSNFANSYTFTIGSSQGQQWMTDGDWVSFSISWDSFDVITHGLPQRSAITDIMLRVADDATGVPVRFHANGLALVATPPPKYPNGVVSFTFDDGLDTPFALAKPLLDAHGFPATAYIIADMIGKPGRMSIEDLHTLDADGWAIAAHAFT